MGLSLILPIGAQNSFVLKQGLKGQHIFWVCLVCALSDAILILVGVVGFGSLLATYPVVINLAKYLGALFLFVYGFLHLKSALSQSENFRLNDESASSLLKTLSLCLAFTWLNPHVYLDTVVLLGSVSMKFAQHQLYFAVGAMMASFLFFFTLGYASRCLLPLFKNPKAWQILDVMIAAVMWWIAFSLIAEQ